jgi:hypothetical protein
MIPDKPTRREVLTGIAAASLFPIASLTAESAASPLCFTSVVEMAKLIRAKKLSAHEALTEHLKQIDRINPKVNADSKPSPAYSVLLSLVQSIPHMQRGRPALGGLTAQ